MGDVIDFFKFKALKDSNSRVAEPDDLSNVASFSEALKQKNPLALAKQRDYGALKELQETIFEGVQEESSFLEQILAVRDPSCEHFGAAEPVARAAELFAFDFLGTTYSDFDKYDIGAYKHFLYEALVYHHQHEPIKTELRSRVIGVTRHLLRHEKGLPKLSDLDAVADYKQKTFGKLSYRFKEYTIQVKLTRMDISAFNESQKRRKSEKSESNPSQNQ